MMDTSVYKIIFEKCDTQNKGSACIDELIQFISIKGSEDLNESSCDVLISELISQLNSLKEDTDEIAEVTWLALCQKLDGNNCITEDSEDTYTSSPSRPTLESRRCSDTQAAFQLYTNQQINTEMVDEAERTILELEKDIKHKEKMIKEISRKLKQELERSAEKDILIKSLENEISALSKEKLVSNETLNNLKENINNLSAELEEKKELQAANEKLTCEVNKLQSEIRELEIQISEQETLINETKYVNTVSRKSSEDFAGGSVQLKKLKCSGSAEDYLNSSMEMDGYYPESVKKEFRQMGVSINYISNSPVINEVECEVDDVFEPPQLPLTRQERGDDYIEHLTNGKNCLSLKEEAEIADVYEPDSTQRENSITKVKRFDIREINDVSVQTEEMKMVDIIVETTSRFDRKFLLILIFIIVMMLGFCFVFVSASFELLTLDLSAACLMSNGNMNPHQLSMTAQLIRLLVHISFERSENFV